MIRAQLANSRDDEYYTPPYAVDPILKYIPPNSSIWCPFDLPNSFFAKRLRDHGCSVITTHLLFGEDFFRIEPPPCDYIISNPPYSKKTEVLEKLFEMNKPFAMLVGVAGLFESQRRFDMFKNNDFEIMFFNRRVSFFKEYDEKKPSLNPPFSSVYICQNILPKTIIFEEIQKR